MNNNLYKLEQKSANHYKLKLTNHKYSKIIANSIIKMLDNSYYDTDHNTINIICESIIIFSDYLKNNNYKISEEKCIKLIDSLYRQYAIIIKESYGLYGLDIEDIIVINDLFIFVSSKYMLPLYFSKIHNNVFLMTLNAPPSSIPYFSSPEIINITTIPATIRIQSFYYTLASLVVYCLTNKYLFEGNDIKSQEEIYEIIKTIKFGKLYWFLERCFHPNPEERKCFLI